MPAKSRKGPKTRGLTPVQIQAAVLLGSGSNFGQTAEAVGVDAKTIWHWRQTPEFQAEIQRAIAETTAAAREHIQASLLKASVRVSDALEAVKPIYLKDGEGFAPVEDVPDHNARLRAAFDVLDRAGIPRKVEAVGDDPTKALAAALAEALRDKS